MSPGPIQGHGLATEAVKRALSTRGNALLQGAVLDPEAGELIAESRGRLAERLAGRDRLVTPLLGGGLVAAAIAMMLLQTRPDVPRLLTVLLVATYAVSSRVEFEIGAGSAVPTELVLVPMI